MNLIIACGLTCHPKQPMLLFDGNTVERNSSGTIKAMLDQKKRLHFLH